jgi:hypothetical protein
MQKAGLGSTNTGILYETVDHRCTVGSLLESVLAHECSGRDRSRPETLSTILKGDKAQWLPQRKLI